MDITPFVDQLRQDLLQTTDAAGDDVRHTAERLATSLGPSVQLMLLDAFSAAAADISNELDDASVEVRLSGRSPEFVVTQAPRTTATPPSPPPSAAEPPADDESGTARITLRLPENLKTKAEQLAATRGQSLNTWLVNAARLAATAGVGLEATGFGPGAPGRNRRSSKKLTGWAE